MKVSKVILLGILTTVFSQFSFATNLEVTHWWTSGSEAAAIRVIADAYKKDR